MYKLGLSTTAKPMCEDLFVQYKEAGISAMELSLKATSYKDFDFGQTAQWSKRHGVELWSCHLPFRATEEFSLVDLSLQKQSINYLSDIIKRASEGGVGKFIAHSSAGGITDDNREEAKKCSKEILFNLAETAKRCGTTVAVENLPPICLGRTSEELAEMISVSDDLRVCVDVNHFLMGESPADFIRKMGHKIGSVHISDYDLINERHWLPGEGKNDWQGILRALGDVNYRGVWLYEVAFIPVHTIERPRDLTCSDFVRNAREIFSGEKITVLGKPAVGLYGED